MRIAVVGTGYVGLVAGVCFAESGNDVVCVDNNQTKVRLLRRGKTHLRAGLEELVHRNRAEKRLTFTTTLAKAVRDSSVIFIAVGTPQGEDESADLKYVLEVARQVARAMNGYKVIVDKSTVPVGTSERVREVVRRETTHPFSVEQTLSLQAGFGDRRLPEARSRMSRRGDPRGPGADAGLYEPFRAPAPIMMDCASAGWSNAAKRCWPHESS
jgi:UDPglucose 6-dehydrogenase